MNDVRHASPFAREGALPDIPGCHEDRHAYLGEAHDANAQRTLWVVALTAAMMVVEIVAGWWTGSMALLADGFHMATHAGALGVAAIAYRYARAHANDPRYTFGTGKVGDLAGFASALVLGVVALGIGWESVGRLIEPQSVAFGEATLVAVIGLVVNLISAWLLASDGHHHGHAHDDDHRHGTDNNLRAAYFHVLADALTSVLAIVALVAGAWLGWLWADATVGVLGAIVIARWSWGLMKDSAGVLLDTADPHIARSMRDAIEEPGDAAVVDLHVWKIGPAAQAAIVTVSGPCETDAVRTRLEAIPGLAHVTVERR